MDKNQALEILRNHTQYFIPTDDLEALNVAMESLEKEISSDNTKQRMGRIFYTIETTVKNLKIENPYFKAFAFEKDIKDDEEYKRDEYIPWINNKWMEWCKVTGSDYYALKNKKDHSLFEEWLFDTVGLNH